tara:strand:- start:1027 stop:4302 length:3276 start_codon:yes stop_codon:yes gene_type:complete
MVKTIEGSQDSLLNNIKLGVNLGVTEVASSEPGKADFLGDGELYAGLLTGFTKLKPNKPKPKKVEPTTDVVPKKEEVPVETSPKKVQQEEIVDDFLNTQNVEVNTQPLADEVVPDDNIINENITTKNKQESNLNYVNKIENDIFKEGTDLSDIAILNSIEDATPINTGKINFKYIETEDDIKKILNSVADRVNNNKIKSFDETKADAKGYNFLENINKKDLFEKGVDLDTQIKSARAVLIDSANQLNILAKQVSLNEAKGITDKKLLLDFRSQYTIHASIMNKYKGMKSEVARALNSLKIKEDGSDSIINYTTKNSSMDQILSDYGGVKTTEKLAKKYLEVVKTKGQAAADNHMVEKGWFRRHVEAVEELYQGGLMWSTRTIMKNAFGSMGYSLLLDVPEKLLMAINNATFNKPLQKGINFVANTKKKIQAKFQNRELLEGEFWGQNPKYDLGNAVSYIHGYFSSVLDALRLAYKATAENKPRNSKTRFDTARQSRITGEYLGYKGKLGTFIDILGKTSGLSFRANIFTDELVKRVSEAAKVRDVAYDVYKRTFNELVDDIGVEKATQAAEKEAQKVLDGAIPQERFADVEEAVSTPVFQNELGNVASKLKAIQRLPAAKFIIPFFDTPTNIVKLVSSYHGNFGLDLIPGFNKNKFYEDPDYRARQIARITLASTIWGTSLYLFTQGHTTGAPPPNKDMWKLLKSKGWQPYSAVIADPNLPPGTPKFDANGIPTGNHTYISYVGLEPLSAFLAMSTSVYETWNYKGRPDSNEEWYSSLVLSSYEYLTQVPMVQALGLVAEVVEGDSYALQKLSETTVGSMLPFSAQFKNYSRFSDGTIKDYSADFEIDYEEYLFETNAKGKQINVVDENGELVNNPNFGLPTSSSKFGSTWRQLITGKNKIYDLISDKKEYPEQLTAFGEPIDRNKGLTQGQRAWNMFVVGTLSKGQTIDQQEIDLLFMGNPHDWDSRQYKGMKLTADQIYYLKKTATQNTFIDGNSYKEAIYEAMLIGTYTGKNENDKTVRKDYSDLTLKEKANFIRTIKDDYYTAAWENKFQYEYPDEYQAHKKRQELINTDKIIPSGFEMEASGFQRQ